MTSVLPHRGVRHEAVRRLHCFEGPWPGTTHDTHRDVQHSGASRSFQNVQQRDGSLPNTGARCPPALFLLSALSFCHICCKLLFCFDLPVLRFLFKDSEEGSLGIQGSCSCSLDGTKRPSRVSAPPSRGSVNGSEVAANIFRNSTTLPRTTKGQKKNSR